MTTETTWANFVNEIAEAAPTTKARRDILIQMINAAKQFPETQNGAPTNTALIGYYAAEALDLLAQPENEAPAYIAKTDLMFLSEVAAYIRRTERGLRQMVREGRAPKHGKVSGRIMFRKSDVDAWINEQFESSNGSN